MTKAEVVSEISDRTGIDKKEVEEVVNNFFHVLKDSMSQGNDVFFRGFGSFIVKRRARKVARNIAKNTSLIIEPHYIPAFKPAKSFAEDVKKKVK
ncbi:MAG: HU family DNA-binding protein [Bacteroidia bacterium]